MGHAMRTAEQLRKAGVYEEDIEQMCKDIITLEGAGDDFSNALYPLLSGLSGALASANKESVAKELTEALSEQAQAVGRLLAYLTRP